MTEHEAIGLARKLRYDLTEMQGKVTELLNVLGRMNLETDGSAVCPKCKLKLKGRLALAEHLYGSHDGPLPDHWAKAEAMADE